MASDTTEKKKKVTGTTKATKPETKKATASKSSSTTKKTSTKTGAATKKGAAKPASKKTTGTSTKKTTVKTSASSKAKKPATTSTKKKTVKKVEAPKIEREDLEEREPDLNKTVVINPEIVKELHAEEDTSEIDSIKVEPVSETKKNKKEEKTYARTILGIDLPTKMTKEDRDERRKFYIKDALIFAIIIPILDLFAMLFIDSYTYLMITNSAPLNYLITLLLDFVLIFIVTYLIDYIFGEDAVKRMNK